jgi:predicted MPP superfamily phosphohydrolase
MSGSPFISESVIALILTGVLLAFIASQFFWILAVRRWGKKVIPNRKLRIGLGALLLVIYAVLFLYNFFGLRHQAATHLTLSAALLQAPFAWWAMSSLAGFGMVALFWLAGLALRLIRAGYSRIAASLGKAHLPVLSSPARRRFLERTAFAASSLPFAACAYGLTIGRTDIETTRKRIRLARLPRAFHGFRVAQLSDLHIGPFMSASQIRHVVQMTNDYKADLVLLTGDYIIWDPRTQGDVVDALSGLRAPFGIVGCLGNHEVWAGCEGSITRMFAERNIRILRHERWPIQTGGEVLNLIGVDYQTVRHFGPHPEGVVNQYLKGVEPLILPDMANILLSHNPNTFDRAAALGIDFSLAGHTHGGQVTLEFINKNLSPSRLITAYVRGWFEKNGCQLYVNRGIGTIGVPIRFDAPPEITIFELVREA